ncbi:hypothetical protein SEA_IMMANUEL3_67 [Streptomyces phage Immanuel3]|uniref:Uncharacterized protein n=1 Tax=Streptomyces phage Immanuel3 TaxID=2053813 RepID=A0A2H4PR98_9CAUD|nr:hypothetical protein HWB41_gp31 [Streptomyces phage Immanuel3]ATW69442.1 hypothetical protein SEA_IMMANUEL3_67 [Streptomyces phage Immanuel3]
MPFVPSLGGMRGALLAAESSPRTRASPGCSSTERTARRRARRRSKRATPR